MVLSILQKKRNGIVKKIKNKKRNDFLKVV